MRALEGLNEMQQQAVCHFEGPLLILAGAGSGKTRVLTNRIAWLIEERHVPPWNILAITFTNKAAGEMRSRVDRLTGSAGGSVWVATFHSTCGRILRRFIDRLGYGTNFTIYDSNDQKALIKEVMRRQGVDKNRVKERTILSIISSAKNELLSPDAFARQTSGDYLDEITVPVYREYQSQLKQNNALDFDDMIMLTVRLFEEHPDVLEEYQNRFRYIMVDEYQDTNNAQFRLISLLAGKYGNLCVVGDDDQSIYRFRGANIRNILSFEEIWPDTRVLRLEQNYRSTKQILGAANAVIANNEGRKAKTLWTENEEGRRVTLKVFDSAYQEAEYVAETIGRRASGASFAAGPGSGNDPDHPAYGDFAILYRTNAQSRLLEEKLLMAGIPYRIIGGTNFYDRKEIKDLLSYLRAVSNPGDDMALRRIINVPRRGIGETTIRRIQDYAIVNSLSFYDAICRAREIPGIGRTSGKIEAFCQLLRHLQEMKSHEGIGRIMQEILEQTGYVKELEVEGTEEAQDRIENIDELISKVVSYELSTAEPALEDFLQEVSLIADVDSLDEGQGQVLLMTIHSAKGLEFPCVFMTGMEEGLFPSHARFHEIDREDLEEERRLCYVGITRAMRELTMTAARTRMLRGEMDYHDLSRFVEEIPEEYLDRPDQGEDDEIPRRGAERPSFAREEAWKRRQDFMRKPFSSPSMDFPFSAAKPRSSAASALSGIPGTTRGGNAGKPDRLDYQEGDRVSHVKFLEGTVLKIVDGGRDYEVTVDFDKYGVKKMFAGFAKLKKI